MYVYKYLTPWLPYVLTYIVFIVLYRGPKKNSVRAHSSLSFAVVNQTLLNDRSNE